MWAVTAYQAIAKSSKGWQRKTSSFGINRMMNPCSNPPDPTNALRTWCTGGGSGPVSKSQQDKIAKIATASVPIKKGEDGRPLEPGPEDCCQSGCRTCVWDLYFEGASCFALSIHPPVFMHASNQQANP